MKTEPIPTPQIDDASEYTERSGKLIVITFAIFAIVVVMYFVLGMPGMNHGTESTMDAMDMGSATATHRLVDPATFAAAIDKPGAVVINVHTPYDGEIDGTDLFMPFDTIDVAALPADRATQLDVYCRSGTMSATAATTLAKLGYTNIVELDGGMQAWQASGRLITRHVTTG